MASVNPPASAMNNADIERERESTGSSVIAADKVAGTAVYNPRGDRLGTIDAVILEKVSGKAVYAVLSFGGFLGIGESHYPLPWSTLKYDTRQGGYVVNLDKGMLEKAPSYDDVDPTWDDRDWGKRVHDYYRATPYWI